MNQLNMQSEMLSPAVKHLLIINVLVWLGCTVCKMKIGLDLNEYFALHYVSASDFRLYQLITYMFMHAGLDHIFFNMFSLFMFGSVIERCLGTQRFLVFYFVSGVGAGLVQELFWLLDPDVSSFVNELDRLAASGQSVRIEKTGELLSYGEFLEFRENSMNSLLTVGASGAIFALLLAFGMLFPNQLVYFYFLIPIKAKYFVIGYAVLELFMGVHGWQVGVAHFAHLGGMLFGFMLLKYWGYKSYE